MANSAILFCQVGLRNPLDIRRGYRAKFGQQSPHALVTIQHFPAVRWANDA